MKTRLFLVLSYSLHIISSQPDPNAIKNSLIESYKTCLVKALLKPTDLVKFTNISKITRILDDQEAKIRKCYFTFLANQKKHDVVIDLNAGQKPEEK